MQLSHVISPHNPRITRKSTVLSALAFVVLALLYVAYFAFITSSGRSGVDYHTFMDIGARWNAGQPIYLDNSYYPMPYVLVFALFAALPLTLSIALWHAIPVFTALAAAQWRLWPLAFAPLFAHMLGGQTAVVGLLAVYGYLHWRDDWRGGAALALATLKPQLALLPLLWVGVSWLHTTYQRRRIPPQALAFTAVTALLYLPTFALCPGWVSDWLASPRPLFARAIAAPIPRLAVMLFGNSTAAWGMIAAGLLAFALFCWRYRPGFEAFMLAGLVVMPFIHDYDLIIFIPVVTALRLQRAAVVASIPLWLTIVLAYTNDQAWFTVALIPLTLALCSWLQCSPRAAGWLPQTHHRPTGRPMSAR